MLAGLTGFSPYDDAVLLNVVEAGGGRGGRRKVEGKKQRETSQGEFHVTVIFKRRLSQFCFLQGCPKICLGAGWVDPDHMQGWI